MNPERIKQWMDGSLSDDDLSDDEIFDLQLRVMQAIEAKLFNKTPSTIFSEHETLQ